MGETGFERALERTAAGLAAMGRGDALPYRSCWATIDEVTFTTSLFPKDDTYLLPLRQAVRNRLGVTADDVVEVEMTIGGGYVPLQVRD